MHGKIADELRFKTGFVNQSLGTSKNTAWVSLADARRALVHVFAATTGNDQHISIQWQEATDSGGSGAQNVGDAIDAECLVNGEGFSAVGEIRADQLSAGFAYVRASVVETGSPTPGLTASAALVLGENRFNPA